MCKIRKYLFILILPFIFFCTNVKALSKKIVVIEVNDVYLRKGPGTNYEYVRKLAINASFDLLSEEKIADESGCEDGWYKIKYNVDSVGYVCSTFAKIDEYIIANETATTECEIELATLGFPQSYWTGLCNLKAKHPTWKFLADTTNLDFPTAVSKESVGKKSLIQTKNEGYLSTAEGSYDYLTDKFTVKEGSNWYSASPEAVAYYMDPRNFLDESSIFMFEKLSFDEKYQTVEAVSSVLQGRDILEYAETIYNAAKTYNVNAIYLASRIRQETGGNYSNYSLAGHSVTNGSGIFYQHIYNPYNIGANTGAGDGIVWAATGTSYLRPWTSIAVAINGGASFISTSYIGQGQDTGYYQKFNTGSYANSSTYSHQYMSNIKAAKDESSITYNGYKNMELLDSTSFTFVIPVYNNMQSSNYELPDPGNPNNHLKSIKINDNELKNFAHDTFEYTYYVSDKTKSIKIDATVINAGASIKGTGQIELAKDENIIDLIVTAANKKEQRYTIKVIKTTGVDLSASDIASNLDIPISNTYMIFGVGSNINTVNDKASSLSSASSVSITSDNNGIIGTGDVITITNNGSSVSFNAVVKGDTSGDGNINIQDLLKVQKHILGYTELNGSFLKAADNNNDGVVNLVDLLRVQKHILGYVTIN